MGELYFVKFTLLFCCHYFPRLAWGKIGLRAFAFASSFAFASELVFELVLDYALDLLVKYTFKCLYI